MAVIFSYLSSLMRWELGRPLQSGPFPFLNSSCICIPARSRMVVLTANKRYKPPFFWGGVAQTATPDFMHLELRLFDPGALKHDLQMIVTDRRDRSAKTQGTQRSQTHHRTRALPLLICIDLLISSSRLILRLFNISLAILHADRGIPGQAAHLQQTQPGLRASKPQPGQNISYLLSRTALVQERKIHPADTHYVWSSLIAQ
ncbi:hypothetical protein BR93DRAFT_299515 [Coniochaeta sp. PMI_546]|nr:hypothetical protein BR93DRAFT_299515 [Coniochaeta sp. PMI_546]